MEIDRIAQLQARAMRRRPLFDSNSGEVVDMVVWTARNGFRHILKIIRMVNNRIIKEERRDPRTDPDRESYCRKKRAWRAANLERIRESDRIRKARYKAKLREQKLLRKIPRTYRTL